MELVTKMFIRTPEVLVRRLCGADSRPQSGEDFAYHCHSAGAKSLATMSAASIVCVSDFRNQHLVVAAGSPDAAFDQPTVL